MALGSSIDTSFVDLKGGTTGQVLSKASNTDLDYTWVTTDDANAIQNAIVDAKGDLIAASAADTPARLAVGNNGETLVADSAATTGLRWQGDYAAGKNKVINGAFDIWQRGTSFSNPANDAYTADRWQAIHDGTSATRTISRQALAPATITGFDTRYFLRYDVSNAGSSNTYQRIGTRIEDVQNVTGTIVVSFWAKADSNRTVGFQLDQYYGSGGSSATVGLQLSAAAALTTSWQRFTATGTMASISGKTVGDGSYVLAYFTFPHNTTLTIDIAGVQIEQGSVATGFTRAGGTLQGELAACQRYYYRIKTSAAYGDFGSGYQKSTTAGSYMIPFPVIMRTAPTALEQTGTAGDYNILHQSGGAAARTTCSAVPTFQVATTAMARVDATVSSGLTAGNGGIFGADNNTNAYLGWSAEL